MQDEAPRLTSRAVELGEQPAGAQRRMAAEGAEGVRDEREAIAGLADGDCVTSREFDRFPCGERLREGSALRFHRLLFDVSVARLASRDTDAVVAHHDLDPAE